MKTRQDLGRDQRASTDHGLCNCEESWRERQSCLRISTNSLRNFRVAGYSPRTMPRGCFLVIRCTQSLRGRNEPTACSPSFPGDLPQLYKSDASPNKRLDRFAFGKNPSYSDYDSRRITWIGPRAEICAV